MHVRAKQVFGKLAEPGSLSHKVPTDRELTIQVALPLGAVVRDDSREERREERERDVILMA